MMIPCTTLQPSPPRPEAAITPRPPRRRRLRAVPTPVAAPACGDPAFRAWTAWLGRRLADFGPTAIEHHLSRFVAVARSLGVELEQARVLADADRCAVERSRAFFAVAMALDRLDPMAPDDGPAAA